MKTENKNYLLICIKIAREISNEEKLIIPLCLDIYCLSTTSFNVVNPFKIPSCLVTKRLHLFT